MKGASPLTPIMGALTVELGCHYWVQAHAARGAFTKRQSFLYQKLSAFENVQTFLYKQNKSLETGDWQVIIACLM